MALRIELLLSHNTGMTQRGTPTSPSACKEGKEHKRKGEKGVGERKRAMVRTSSLARRGVSPKKALSNNVERSAGSDAPTGGPGEPLLPAAGPTRTSMLAASATAAARS